MHARLLTVPTTLLMMAFGAAPALADQSLGLGQPADADGVVTSFTIGGTTAQTVQLRSLQALGGGGGATETTATSDPVTATPGQRVAARVPIAAGGTLTLLGASGSPTVTATVEPDTDGDGYGDTTQDDCHGDFTDQGRPCGGTRTIGSPLTLAPDPRGFTRAGNPLQALTHLDPAVLVTATPDPWVLTRWRVRADPTKGDTVLQVLRRDSMTAFTVLGESAPIHVTGRSVVSVPARIPLDGEVSVGARSVTSGGQSDLGAVAHVAGDALDTLQPPVSAGQSFSTNGSAPDLRLLVQADAEPDKDRDGKGDVTQDQADLVLTGSAPAEIGALDTSTQTYTVRNAGPDAALEPAVAFVSNGDLSVSSDRPGVTCLTGDDGAGAVAWVCHLGTLERGATATITLGRNSPDSAQFTGPTVTTRATARALTTDPDTTNNVVTLTTTRRPYVPNLPPQQPFVVPACANVIRGTRDDDVLRGTLFGDRLVGNDGDDLLKGSSGDDCLEGGAGNDVMDGGDGNDRLAGSSGKDRLTGGNGNDKLTAGKGNDRLSGGNGNDVLAPGDGKDVIAAGPGNDTINSVDGVRETVDCGAGRDTVRADRRDRLIGCEKVTRRP